MLTRQELAQLERSLRATKVLSVYLDGTATDPALRTAWRRDLERLLAQARHALKAAPHDEREAFDACVRQLSRSLPAEDAALGAPGWVGLFTPDREAYVEPLPVAMPLLVAWGDGARIAPYLRVLKHHRPVIVVLTDARRARLYRYAEGELARLDMLRAQAHLTPPEHMGHPPTLGFHTGTRGATGTDKTARRMRMGTQRMLRALADRIAAVAPGDEWIVIGGIPEVASAAAALLPDPVRARVRGRAGLDVHALDSQIRKVAAETAEEATRARDLSGVEDLVDRLGPVGRGSLGLASTVEALREHAVARLYLTAGFWQRHPLEAESVVREAMAEASEVEHLSDGAAERLDAAGEGLGAVLRFTPSRLQVPLAEPSADTAAVAPLA